MADDRSVYVPSGIIMVVGLWLIASPFVLGEAPAFERGVLSVILSGMLIALLGAGNILGRHRIAGAELAARGSGRMGGRRPLHLRLREQHVDVEQRDQRRDRRRPGHRRRHDAPAGHDRAAAARERSRTMGRRTLRPGFRVRVGRPPAVGRRARAGPLRGAARRQGRASSAASVRETGVARTSRSWLTSASAWPSIHAWMRARSTSSSRTAQRLAPGRRGEPGGTAPGPGDRRQRERHPGRRRSAPPPREPRRGAPGRLTSQGFVLLAGGSPSAAVRCPLFARGRRRSAAGAIEKERRRDGRACSGPGLRHHRHRRRHLRPVPALPPARDGAEGPRVRGGHRRRRHLVLEPLPRLPLRLRELLLRLLVQPGAARRVGLDRALRRPSRRPSATSTTSPTSSTCAGTSSSGAG